MHIDPEPGSPAAQKRTNWAGNHAYQAMRLHEPSGVDALRAVLADAQHVRALGTRHCFNGIADIEGGDQISLHHFNGMELNPATALVTIGPGVTYAQLAPWLQAQGYALPNLASLPHISVVGATQTGTHGSGSANGSLATSVEALELVTASGDVQQFSRAAHGSRFDGMVVALGALGIVAKLSLRVVPSFAVRQTVYEGLPFDRLAGNLEDIFASAYSVSLFTDWKSRTVTQAWLKQRVEPGMTAAPKEFYGAHAATRDLHPLPGHDAQNCTPQCGIPGPWHEHLPHFRSAFTPSSGNELQSEYLVPLNCGYAAIEAIDALGDLIAPHLFISELRTIAADALWLSPSFGRVSLALHFTWKPHWPSVQRILPRIEAALAPFDARPHWGKLFTMEPAHVRTLYPRLGDFRALAVELDPQEKFCNSFLDRYVFAG